MMWMVLASAWAADPVIAVDVRGPDGSVLLSVEQGLPIEHEAMIEVDGRKLGVRLNGLQAGDVVALTTVITKGRGNKALFESVQMVPIEDATMFPAPIPAPKRSGVETWDLAVDAQWLVPVDAAPQPVELPDSWPDRRFMVVWNDAPLRADFSASSPAVMRSETADHARPTTGASVYRKVGPPRASVEEVESVPTDLLPHCYDSVPALKDYPFQYFISRDHALAVTKVPVSRMFEDGTGYSLAAGVAVFPVDGGYEARVAGLRLPVEVGEDDVGVVYKPSPHDPGDAAPWQLIPLDGVIGTMNGLPLSGALDAYQVVGRSGIRAPMVTIRQGCVELRLQADGAQLTARP